MFISPSDYRLLVEAFQFVFDSLPNDPEKVATFHQAESFLNRVAQQPNFSFSSGEIDNCVIFLQLFCAKSSFATEAHRDLLQRFLSLQMRSFG